MTMKTILLGSAATIASFSNVYAADAVVAAEPEPVEYVRVCDAYGAGYFYIPGTETCLKVGGKVRTEASWYSAYQPDSSVGTNWHTRAELKLDTAADTEWGALKTSTIMQFNWTDGVESDVLNWATISLGGFTAGKADSQFNQYLGYAGNVIHDDVIAYGPYDTNLLSYTYDPGNGFTTIVSLEDPTSGNHYAPDPVLGFGYKTDKFGFKVVGGYDSLVKEGAIKARADADFGAFSGFLMAGWNTDGNKINRFAPSDGAGTAATIGWGNWALWTGFTVPLTTKVSVNTQFAYSDSQIFATAANVVFTPVKNLSIEPELNYTRWESIGASQIAGILRIERVF